MCKNSLDSKPYDNGIVPRAKLDCSIFYSLLAGFICWRLSKRTVLFFLYFCCSILCCKITCYECFLQLSTQSSFPRTYGCHCLASEHAENSCCKNEQDSNTRRNNDIFPRISRGSTIRRLLIVCISRRTRGMDWMSVRIWTIIMSRWRLWCRWGRFFLLFIWYSWESPTTPHSWKSNDWSRGWWSITSRCSCKVTGLLK